MTGSQNNIAAAPAGPASGPDGVSPGAAGTSPAEAAQPQAALAFFDEEEGAAAAAAASQAVVQGIKRDQSEEDGAPEPTAAKRQRVRVGSWARVT